MGDGQDLVEINTQANRFRTARGIECQKRFRRKRGSRMEGLDVPWFLFIFAYAMLVGNGGAKAKEVDLRTMSDPTGEYNVAFCSRPSPDTTGKPGHAFVSYSHVLPGGNREFLAIGHTVGADVTPAKAIWSYFSDPVSGLLKEELYTSIRQRCLDVQVDKSDYDRARARASNALALLGIVPADAIVLEAYKLGAEDCMTFLIDVANSLKSKGLNVPARQAGELPMPYVQRLSDAN